MHISLDQATGRQPRLNRVGQSILNIGGDTFGLAYSLRSLTGGEPKAVRIRRDGDNEERDFTTAEIVNEAADWTNGKQETTLPADVATSAAAYSLRKVKSDYTGPAVRIRRESDDVEVNVSFDTNDEVSTSSPIENTTEQGGESGSTTATTLGEFISGTNAAVHTWYDQSGNSKNATEEVAANQPLIAESGVLHTDNGKPALKFNGTSHRLDLSAKATIANTSIFSAFRSNDSTQDSVLFHFAVDSSNVVSIGFGDLATRTELGSRLKVGGSNVVEVGDNTFTSTSQSLLSYIASSSAAKMFIDSTEETDTVQSRTSGANNRIGARGDDDKFFNGDISEVILFDSDQTNNRFKIESNILNHYGILDGTSLSSSTAFFLDGTAGSPSSFTADGLDGFTMIMGGAGNVRAGIELQNKVPSGKHVVVSFDADLTLGTGTATPIIKLMKTSLSGTGAGTNFDIIQGRNTISLNSNDNDAKFVLFLEGNTNVGYSISNFTMSLRDENGFVERWYDQSSNSTDLVNTASSTQPKIVNSGSYLGYIDFSLSTQKLLTPSLSGSGVFPAGAKMASLVVASSDANGFNQVWADPTYSFYNYFGLNVFHLNTIGGSSVTQGQFNQFGGYFNGSSSVLDKNNTAYGTGTISDTASELTSLSLGDGATLGIVSKFQIKELVLNNSNSDSISTQISTSQINHFGTPN